MADREPIDRMAEAAKRIVDESTAVAKGAADHIDRGTYTADAMVDAASRLSAIAARSWLEFAGLAAGVETSPPPPPREPDRPDPVPDTQPVRIKGNGLGSGIQQMSALANRMFLRNLEEFGRLVDQRVSAETRVVTEHMNDVVRQMAEQTRTAIDEAADRFDNAGYGPDDFAETVTKLGDIALINGIDLIGTAVIGPGKREAALTSDEFTAPNADPSLPHKLCVKSPLVLVGGTETIPHKHLTFVPAEGLLQVGVNAFRFQVNAAGLRSGIYEGEVWVQPLDATAAMPAEPPEQEIVSVIIGL